jgi:hypothetical protein
MHFKVVMIFLLTYLCNNNNNNNSMGGENQYYEPVWINLFLSLYKKLMQINNVLC